MRIDLHTHSSRSDGTDTPAELMEKAKAVGLDVIALTDHDATVGWDEAQEAADRVGTRLVKGMEMSTIHHGRSVHLLGYEFDPDDVALNAELQRVRDSRDDRAPKILEKLNSLGYELTMADVERHSGSAAALGRPHFADALVATGQIKDRSEAFTGILNSGGAAYVPRYSTPILEAIALLNAAGGKTVIAHPWADRDGRLTLQDLTSFADAGLDGLEVDHPDHPDDLRAQLRVIAADLNLAMTGSSDHHGLGKTEAFRLGACTTAPDQFERLFG